MSGIGTVYAVMLDNYIGNTLFDSCFLDMELPWHNTCHNKCKSTQGVYTFRR